MSNVENFVVSMTFDNREFERRIRSTMVDLDRLKQSLSFNTNNNGFAQLQAQANSFNTSHMASSVANISSKFSALGAIGFSILQRLTNEAVSTGQALVRSVLTPLIEGGRQRALNIEQAQFQFRGLGQDVEASMASALAAVEGTAYGLDEAAKVAGQLGAAGVNAGDDLTGALRGVAGIAALTGSSFSDIGMIFTQIAGQGRVLGNDLLQFGSRGINVAKALGDQLGVTEAEARQLVSEGSIDIATFANAMNAAFGEHATKANETFTGSLANMKTALARIGAAFFTPQLTGMRDIFNSITPVIDEIKTAAAPLISTWTSFIERRAPQIAGFFNSINATQLEKTFQHVGKIFLNVYRAIKSVLTPIKDAFKAVFPASFINVLNTVTKAIRDFTGNLKLSSGAALIVKQVFKGIFSIFAIGWEVIKGVADVFKTLFENIAPAGSKIGAFAGNIGNMIFRFKKALVEGGAIKDFFDNISDAIGRFFDKIRGGGIDSFGRVGQRFGLVASAVKALGSAFGWVLDRLSSLKGPIGSALSWIRDRFLDAKNAISSVIDYFRDAFSGLGESLGNSLKEGDFSNVLDIINTVLIGGIAVLIRKFTKDGPGSLFNIFVNPLGGTGFLDSITGAFRQLTGVFEAMQTQLKANALMKIAQAIAVLTASVFVLSLIDSAALSKALAAMAVGFGQLVAAFALLNKLVADPKSAAKVGIIATGMIVLASAMLILSFAVKTLSTMDWGELGRGLLGLAGMLTILVVAVKPLATNSAGLITAGLGLIAVAVAMNIMALAVKSMSELSLSEIGRGLVGVGGGLVVIATAMRFMPPNLLINGVALGVIATSLIVLSFAVKQFASIDYKELLHGLIGFAGALGVIALGMTLMPSNMLLTAGGLLIVSVALLAIAEAVKLMGDISWEEMGRGLAGLAGALTILAIAAYAMEGTIAGAIAIGIMSVSLLALAVVLKVLGGMKWEDIGKGLVAIAGAIAILAIAALLLSEAVPAIAALGLALITVAAAFAIFGAGAYLVARSIQILAESGSKGADAVKKVMENAITLVPSLIAALAQGIVDFLDIIYDAAPSIIEGMLKVLNDLLLGFTKMAPEITNAINAFLGIMLDVIYANIPQIVAIGFLILMSLLQGVRENISEITTSVSEIVVAFLTSLTEKLPEIIDAGTNFIVALLFGISQNIGMITEAALTVLTNFLDGIASKMEDVVTAGGNIVIAIVYGIGAFIGNLIKAGAKIISSIITGMGQAIQKVINAGMDVVLKLMQGIRENTSKLTIAAAQLILQLIKDLTKAINTYAPQLRSAALELGRAIVNGMTLGLSERAGGFISRVTSLARDAVASAKSILNINSPSLVFKAIGSSIVEGFSLGISENKDGVNATKAFADNIIKSFNNVTTGIDLASGIDTYPVITPVLDLTNIEANAGKLTRLLGVNPVQADLSFGNASTISVDTNRQNETNIIQDSPPQATAVTFEQNIYSPTELSVGEIYRQTRTQIERAKEELGI